MKPPADNLRKYFAQFGEDRILDAIFHDRGNELMNEVRV